MVLLVQTPRGTVSLPPQGFFQQQPSPFADFLSPTGLPPASPVSFAPRIPTPSDINSSALVQERAAAPVIPQSSPPRFRAPDPGPADDPFDSVPTVDPNSLTAPDPASLFGAVGTLTGVPGLGVLGSALGNTISYSNLPPGIPGTIDLGEVALNVFSPFGMTGKSVAKQAAPALHALNTLDTEFRAQQVDPVFDAFNPPIDPVFDPFDPPDAPGDPGDSPGPGSPNAANTGQEDVDEDPDPEPEGVEGTGDEGDPSFICTAAWATGISAPATWSNDKRMLAWIVRNDPQAYAGYKKVGPWIARRVHRGKLLWMARLFPRSWAYEIDQRQGKDTSGYPLSIKIENRLQRAFVRPLFRLWGRA